MIYFECKTCRQQGRCPSEGKHCREALFAHRRDMPAPECKDHQPRLYHGVEGVIDRAPSPRPSRHRSIASIDHGGRAC